MSFVQAGRHLPVGFDFAASQSDDPPLQQIWKDLQIDPRHRAKFNATTRDLCRKLFLDRARPIGHHLAWPDIVFTINANTLPAVADIEKLAEAFANAGLRSLAAHLLAAVADQQQYGIDDRLRCLEKCKQLLTGEMKLHPEVERRLIVQPFDDAWTAALSALDGSQRQDTRRHNAKTELRKLTDCIRSPADRALIAAGFDKKPGEYKRVLKQAILGGHRELVEFLVEHPKLPRGFLDNSVTGHKRARNSLLCYAARRPTTDIAKYLLSKGFTGSMIAKGANPLAEAVKAGDREMVDLLRAQGCPISATVVKAAYGRKKSVESQWLIEALAAAPEQFDALPRDRQLDVLELAFKSEFEKLEYSNLDFIQIALKRNPGHVAPLSLRVGTLDAWLRSLYAQHAADNGAAETFKILVPNEQRLQDAIRLLCWQHPGCDWMVKPLIESQIVREAFPNVDATCRKIANDPKSKEARPEGQDTVAATLEAVFEDTPWVLDPSLITQQVVDAVRESKDAALAQRLIDCFDDRAMANLPASTLRDLARFALNRGNGNYTFIRRIFESSSQGAHQILNETVLAYAPIENRAALAQNASFNQETLLFQALVPNEAVLKSVIRAQCGHPTANEETLRFFLAYVGKFFFTPPKVSQICEALRKEAIGNGNLRIAQLVTRAAYLPPPDLPTPADSTASANHDPLDRPIVPQHDQ